MLPHRLDLTPSEMGDVTGTTYWMDPPFHELGDEQHRKLKREFGQVFVPFAGDHGTIVQMIAPSP